MHSNVTVFVSNGQMASKSMFWQRWLNTQGFHNSLKRFDAGRRSSIESSKNPLLPCRARCSWTFLAPACQVGAERFFVLSTPIYFVSDYQDWVRPLPLPVLELIQGLVLIELRR